jgi:phosphohistidine phosphatase SixA
MKEPCDNEPRLGSRVNILRRLGWYVVASLGITVLSVGALGLLLRQSLRDSATLTETTLNQLGRSHAVSEQLAAVNGALQQMLVLKDPDELEKKLKELEADTRQMETLAAGCGEAGAAILVRFRSLAATQKKVIELLLVGNAAQANELFINTGGPQSNEVLAEVRKYHHGVETATRGELALRETVARRALMWRGAAFGLAVLLVAALGWRLKVVIARRLNGVCHAMTGLSGRLSAASAQVSASSDSLARGACAQAATVEETSASLTELTSMVRRNADSAQQAKELADQTRASADAGTAGMEAMQRSMAEIRTATDSVARIVRSIEEVAFQTGILSLNAAVEAARAGEAGAGFAVVADEVRRLAQRSAAAAQESSGLIDDVREKTVRGVQTSGVVAASLQQITARVHSVDALVAEIAVACREQAQGVTQLSEAMNQIDQVTQSASVRADETAHTAADLQRHADTQHQAVQELLELVGADTLPEAPTAEPAAKAAMPRQAGEAVEAVLN